jgi:Mg/Co/Ni transporter MgtE
MLAVREPLTLEEIEAQSALELPEREVPVTVIIGCIGVCVGKIKINVEDVNVAAQVCAAVQALNILSLVVADLTCDIRQN